MDKDEYKVRIGKDKMLVYHPDPSRETDTEFVRQFREAGSSNPATLQDFFIRLAEIQKQTVYQNNMNMQIELKNIRVAEHMSEETIAFTANLYVNNNKIAFVKNEGHGGSTSYQLYKNEDTPLLKKVEEHCKSLPPTVYQDPSSKREAFTVPMNLENYIDNLLEAHIQKKDLEKFHRKMAKHQENGILFGIPDRQYKRIQFTKPLAEILQSEKGTEAIRNCIQQKILPHLKEGEIILNTNLPPDLMQLERKRPPRQSSRVDDSPDKKQGRRR